jgi:hypothetical protein
MVRAPLRTRGFAPPAPPAREITSLVHRQVRIDERPPPASAGNRSLNLKPDEPDTLLNRRPNVRNVLTTYIIQLRKRAVHQLAYPSQRMLPPPAPRYHDKRPLAVWGPLQRRKKAQDTREPYLATTGGHDERMSSVSSIAGAPVNVVLPRGKDDDQNWPPKAPIESITPSSRVYQYHRPEVVLHPSTSGSGERRGNRLMLPQSV